uniref:Gustatory receptor n=1 Tax=Lobesia botrana TaxID=209534 RepID=A0A345BEZ7_9NEOP|nr:gustatory receptor GR8.1 [Lobesia botrana]
MMFFNLEDILKEDRPPSECVVSGSLAHLLRASSRAGVCPLRFTRVQNGWLMAVSSPLAAIQRVFMTVLNLVMLAAFIMDFCQDPEDRIRVGETTLKAFVWISDMALMMVIASIAVYMGPSRMESLIQVQNQLQQVSIELKMQEPSAKSERFRNIVIFGIIIWAIMILSADFCSFLEISISEDKMWSIMCMYSTYYVGNLMGVLVVVQWAYAVVAVRSTVIALNEELYKLRHANIQSETSATLEDLLWPPKSERNNLVDCFSRPRKINPGGDSSASLLQAQATIRRLALSHERISDLTRQMNATNGLFLMIVLMSTFLRLVLTPYYLLLRLENDERVVSETVLQLNWSVFHVLVLLLTIEPCHWTQEQMERTQILLSQLVVHLAPKCERLSKELDQFAKQILLSNTKFMTLGIYPLARPLMATIFGGVTTYLVIIIQFQKISDQL